eukprot:2007680-Rhodomonas_salina.2
MQPRIEVLGKGSAAAGCTQVLQLRVQKGQASDGTHDPSVSTLDSECCAPPHMPDPTDCPPTFCGPTPYACDRCTTC